VPENQHPTFNSSEFHFSWLGYAFIVIALVGELDFFKVYFTFLKIMYSIALWSTCLNLLLVVAFRLITVDLPRLGSTLTK
jgi:hypothetical protein